MKLCYAFIIMLFVTNAFCQDTIMMRNNGKLIAKVLEISSTEVKYKRFENIEGPDYVVSKNDIRSISYQNGSKDVFETTTEPTKSTNADNVFVNPTPPKGSQKKETKVGDYIKFNMQAGAVMYNSYCNVPRRDQIAMTSSYEYKKISDRQNTTFNIGFNFIFGNNQYVKHVIGINYLRTQGEFIYDWGYIGANSYSKYKSIIDYVNLTSGPRFTIANKIHIAPLLAINIAVHSKTTHSGSETNFEHTPPYTTNTTTFENKPTTPLVGTTLSLAPKISYEIALRNRKVELFYSYNISYGARLPWHFLGFCYYPFKKLQPTSPSNPIKLFSNVKTSIEAGITLNNNETNLPKITHAATPYEYESTDAINKRKVETGVNLNINFINGNNNYCKHVMGLSYVTSTTEYKRYSRLDVHEGDKIYEHLRRLNYYTKTHYLSLSTGIRFVLFKFINIDHSIAYNLPFFATNKINGYESLEELTLGTSNIYKRTNYSENQITTSSKEILMKPCLAFSPKVSFSFKVKNQIFGLYFNLNYGITQKMQWHMIGLTYYPFKKLR